MASTKRPAPPKPADEPKAVASAPAAKAAEEAKPAAAKPIKKAAPKAAAPAKPAKAARSSAAKAGAAPAEAAPAKQAGAPGPLPDQAEIDRMIAEAAYYLAEKRNFQPGFEKEDWETATEEVMAKLRGGDAS